MTSAKCVFKHKQTGTMQIVWVTGYELILKESGEAGLKEKAEQIFIGRYRESLSIDQYQFDFYTIKEVEV